MKGDARMASDRKEYFHEWYENNRKPKRRKEIEKKKIEDVIKILDVCKENPYYDKFAIENLIRELNEVLELKKEEP